MTVKEAIEILNRLRDAYSKAPTGDDIVTAIDFAVDSLVIVGDCIENGWKEDDNEHNFSESGTHVWS